MENLDYTALSWKKSSRSSGTGQCVEVALLPSGIAVRDSKNPGGGVLAVTGPAWSDFIHAARSGRFDLPA